MSSENRRVPGTNTTRQAALTSGKTKNDAMGVAGFISTSTAALLNTNQPAYNAAMIAVSSGRAVYLNATIVKEQKATDLEMVCSHFI